MEASERAKVVKDFWVDEIWEPATFTATTILNMHTKIVSAYLAHAARFEDLFRELEPLNEALLNQKPENGGWSAIQTLHHLILVEENSLAYLHKKLSFNPKFEKPGLSASIRLFLLRIALFSPIKFKAPKSTAPEIIPETENLSKTKARWQEIRWKWVDFLENIPPELLDKAVYKHPRAGRLSWLQTITFLRLHLDRHRGQILRAVR